MKTLIKFVILVLCLFSGLLHAQVTRLSLENFENQLTSLVIQNDHLYKEIYLLLGSDWDPINKRGARQPMGQAQFRVGYDVEESLFRIYYLMGQVTARENFIKDATKQLKKMKSQEISAIIKRQGPYDMNIDMRRTVDPRANQSRDMSALIEHTTQRYDSAIRFTQKLYKEQTKRQSDIWTSQEIKNLTNTVFNYHAFELHKTANQIMNGIDADLKLEKNKGMRDAGGMSDRQYKIRVFLTNIVIPIFMSFDSSAPATSLPEAVISILEALPAARH